MWGARRGIEPQYSTCVPSGSSTISRFGASSTGTSDEGILSSLRGSRYCVLFSRHAHFACQTSHIDFARFSETAPDPRPPSGRGNQRCIVAGSSTIWFFRGGRLLPVRCYHEMCFWMTR